MIRLRLPKFPLMAGIFLVLMPLQPMWAESTDEEEFNIYEKIGLISETLSRIDNSYVEEVDKSELIQAALDGMLSSLDPHSGYISPEEMMEMEERTTGEFGGLGIQVTTESGYVKVISPIDDTPAFEAGIQAGDYIIEIEGKTVLEMDLQEAVDRMRGPPGEDITITILRENVDNPFEVTITRDIIQIEAAEVRRIGDVIIARVKTFSNQAIPNLEEGIEEVVAEYGDIHDFSGIVIDLRNNPGGLLQSAVGVTDLFLEEGDIVSIRRRDDQADTFKAGDYYDGDISHGIPIVVLINSGSASASEIVAGALQDNERAAVIGTQSFGKGSVQTLIDLDSEKGVDSSSERKFGGLRMTTAKYYTPSGKSIQGNGITPDILLEWQYVEVEEEEEDARYLFSEAKYDNSLENDGIPINEEEQEEMAQLNEALEELRRTDNQLGYAIDLIHGFKALGSGKF